MNKLKAVKAVSCARQYIGAAGPGLSRTGIKFPPKNGQVPRIDRTQYKVYLETLSEPTHRGPGVTVSKLPITAVPNAHPSGWTQPHNQIPDLPYFVWRKLDQTLPVDHKESEEFRRITQISKIEGDIQLLKEDIQIFLEDESIPVVANELLGTITILGWRAFEVKKWLQLQGF